MCNCLQALKYLNDFTSANFKCNSSISGKPDLSNITRKELISLAAITPQLVMVLMAEKYGDVPILIFLNFSLDLYM